MSNFTDNKSNILARDILNYARECILINFPFFANSISLLDSIEDNETNAEKTMWIHKGKLHFQTNGIIMLYGSHQNLVIRTYLHCLLHYCFRHDILLPEKATQQEMERHNYTLATDMAICALIFQLNQERFMIPLDLERKQVLDSLKEKIPYWSAQNIMEELAKSGITSKQRTEWEGLFLADDHSCWESTGRPDKKREQMEKQLKTQLDTFSKRQSNQGLLLALRKATAEPVDYAFFLKRFACIQEVIQLNEEEFDLGYYLYGLRQNARMPLVEPLEYADVGRIKDFVIAIDTSGSTAGKLVQGFLDKTFTILQSTNSLAEQLRIHVIQCDDRIRSDTVIHNRKEMEEQLTHLTIKGFGATDFTPVFTYVDDLIKEHKLTNLRGLLYFTDGRGRYPIERPPYDTAFVFLEDEEGAGLVPPWAIGVSLTKRELQRNSENGDKV